MRFDAQSLRAGERGAVTEALNAVTSRDHTDTDALLDALVHQHRPDGHVVGLTGPPGVGKSTLAGRLIASWRSEGLRVGVLAVDPSSRRSGGALLGDRARMGAEADEGVFIRSLAAGTHLGGLAAGAFESVAVLRAAYDRVLVETVGVGQSEIEVAEVVDTTVVILQPASGDSLQFLKAGLMEVPDLVVVNKSDLGRVARKTHADAVQALAISGRNAPEVVSVSAHDDPDMGPLRDTIDRHRLDDPKRLAEQRRHQLHSWLVRRLVRARGQEALAACGGEHAALSRLSSLPEEATVHQLQAALETP